MKEDIKNKWVKALRSGDYKQTKGALRRRGDLTEGKPAGYCCLGVLCDISGLAEWGDIPDDRRGDVLPDARSYDGTVEFPPRAVLSWAGIRSIRGVYTNDARDNLGSENDAGRSFNEIADIIETHWREM